MEVVAQDDARQRVLVVDDHADMRRLLTLALGLAGYAVQTADHDLAALALLRDWRPDIILLDLMMPFMNSWDFLRAQLADPRLAATPVVMMTACLDADAAVLGPSVAAVLRKPFHLKTLVDTIDHLTRPDEASCSAQ